jgi:hypothetical protein
MRRRDRTSQWTKRPIGWPNVTWGLLLWSATRRSPPVSQAFVFRCRPSSTIIPSFELSSSGLRFRQRQLQPKPLQSLQPRSVRCPIFPLRTSAHNNQDEQPNDTTANVPTSASFRLWENAGAEMYDEQRPRRTLSSVTENPHAPPPWASLTDRNDWGVHVRSHPPLYPHTLDQVVSHIFHAVAATLYGQQMPDPNVVRNIWQGDTLHGRRPTRARWDAGRIGIELDHVQALFARENSSSSSSSSASGIRKLSLLLAGKLATQPWDGYETNQFHSDTHRITKGEPTRPIVLYFNTIKQALMASHELGILRRIEHETHATTTSTASTRYDSVTILSLDREATIPESLCRRPRRKGTSSNPAVNGCVDPTRGLLILVQPTDYDDEYRPPGPNVGSVERLQRLVAQAAIYQLPTVVLSPRYLKHPHFPEEAYEQSGFQQSGYYGGVEPPKGPTPWVLRDFTPPVLSWIGNALPVTRNARYRGVALWQSNLDEGHGWHVYGVPRMGGTTPDYLASTRTASGRPTQDVMRRVLAEFSRYDESTE